MATRKSPEAVAGKVDFVDRDDRTRQRLVREIAGLEDSLQRMTGARDAAQEDIDRTTPLLEERQAQLEALGGE